MPDREGQMALRLDTTRALGAGRVHRRNYRPNFSFDSNELVANHVDVVCPTG